MEAAPSCGSYPWAESAGFSGDFCGPNLIACRRNLRRAGDWITSLAILVLGLIGWMNQWWAFGIVGTGAAIAVILLFARNRNRNLAPWVTEPAGWGWLWIAAAAVAGVVTLAAFFPPGLLWGDEPNGYDVVEYHLQVPREWYEAGRIIPLHHNVFSYFPFNVEMQYLLAMWLHGGSRGPWAGMYLAQLMHTAICGVAAWAVYGLAGGGKRGIVAGLITAAIPWTGLLAAVSYNDGGTLLFGILAIGWAIREPRLAPISDRRSDGGIRNGDQAVGGSTSARGAGRHLPGKKYLVGCVLYLAMGLLVLSPWLIRNWQWTGNPVFPEAMSVFGKGDFSGVQAERWRQAYLPDVAYRSPAGRIRALWDQVVADWRYGYVLLPLGCAAVILTRKNPATICLAILLIVQTGFWLCFTHLQSRFMVMIIPMIALLIAQYESQRLDGVCTVIAVGLACFSIAMLIGKMTRYLQTDHDKVSLIAVRTWRDSECSTLGR